MQVHDVSINKKYFEPINDNLITLLIFKQHVLPNAHVGDYISVNFGSYMVKAKIKKIYIKAFRDITEQEAKKAGFITKDFLKDELINLYNIEPVYQFGLGSIIDSELFLLVELDDEEEENFTQRRDVELYKNTYKITEWGDPV